MIFNRTNNIVLGRCKSAFWMILLSAILLSISSCGDKSMAPRELDLNFNRYDIPIIQVDLADRWPPWNSMRGLELNFPHDIDGVILVEYDNQYRYQPLYVASYGLGYLASYLETSDTLYLNRATVYANRLLELGTRENDCIYLTYDFQYRLHNGSYNEVMLPPWFSGIAQGFGLAFISRIYQSTGNPYYLYAADSVFNAFLYTDDDGDVWITDIDSSGYYWIEEYPFVPKTRVLNGFLFAISGLYEYYQVTQSGNCRIVFQGACTTIKDNVYRYRVPGQISYYCLLHRSQYSEYHQIVIRQLRYISQITGDDFFRNFADTLAADHAP